MKSKFALAVIVCLVVTADAQELWGGESARPRWQVYALEGLGALGGCVGCGCLGSVGTTFAASTGALAPVGFCILAVGAAVLPAAAGFGAAKAGEGLGEDGSTGGAIVGAYAGALVGVGYAVVDLRLFTHSDIIQSEWHFDYLLGAVISIPIGAVVGYNLGPTSDGVGGRLQLPSVALTSAELPDHSFDYGVKVQLAGLRF